MACIAEPQAKTETAPCMLRRANAVSTIHWNTSNAAIPQLIKPFEMENRIKSEAGTSRSPAIASSAASFNSASVVNRRGARHATTRTTAKTARLQIDVAGMPPVSPNVSMKPWTALNRRRQTNS